MATSYDVVIWFYQWVNFTLFPYFIKIKINWNWRLYKFFLKVLFSFLCRWIKPIWFFQFIFPSSYRTSYFCFNIIHFCIFSFHLLVFPLFHLPLASSIYYPSHFRTKFPMISVTFPKNISSGKCYTNERVSYKFLLLRKIQFHRKLLYEYFRKHRDCLWRREKILLKSTRLRAHVI